MLWGVQSVWTGGGRTNMGGGGPYDRLQYYLYQCIDTNIERIHLQYITPCAQQATYSTNYYEKRGKIVWNKTNLYCGNVQLAFYKINVTVVVSILVSVYTTLQYIVYNKLHTLQMNRASLFSQLVIYTVDILYLSGNHLGYSGLGVSVLNRDT